MSELGGHHVLLLNKFNIVPWHCLVVTVEFRRQEEELDAGDLGATWRVMQVSSSGALVVAARVAGCPYWHADARRACPVAASPSTTAAPNPVSGCCPAWSPAHITQRSRATRVHPCILAGASQPHKHVQVVPLPLDDLDRTSDPDGGSSSSSGGARARPPIWSAIAAATEGREAWKPVELRSLPFAAFAVTLDGDKVGSASAETGAQLQRAYQQLMELCRAFVAARTGQQGVSPLDGTLSYNLGERPRCRADTQRALIGKGSP